MRFTIRDVFWLTVVVGLAVGWWLNHGRIYGMNWQWRDMHEQGLFLKDVQYVRIHYSDGSETIYDENRGVRHLKYANP